MSALEAGLWRASVAATGVWLLHLYVDAEFHRCAATFFAALFLVIAALALTVTRVSRV